MLATNNNQLSKNARFQKLQDLLKDPYFKKLWTRLTADSEALFYTLILKNADLDQNVFANKAEHMTLSGHEWSRPSINYQQTVVLSELLLAVAKTNKIDERT